MRALLKVRQSPQSFASVAADVRRRRAVGGRKCCRRAGESASLPRRLQSVEVIRLVRGELDWIVMKALEKDRNGRYDTANSLAIDIQRHLQDEPVSAGPPTARYLLTKFVRKHRVAVAVAAGFVALLSIATVVSTTLAHKATKAERDARDALRYFEEKVLAAARPEGQEGGLGYDVTLLAALRSAEPSIVSAFSNQPLAEASVRDVLARSYQYLGDYTNAIAQSERVLLLLKRHAGPDSLQTLLSMNSLGVAYKNAAQTNNAVILLEETVRRMKARLGPNNTNTLYAMNNLANAYRDDRTLPLLEEAYTRSKTAIGPNNPETLLFAYNLANEYRRLRRIPEAIAWHEETLKQRQVILGPDHPDTLKSRNSLANVYLDARRLPDALTLQTQTVQLMTAKLPPTHPHLLQAMYNLANIYLRLPDLPAAIELHALTLERRKAKLGPDHRDTVQSMSSLANAYFDNQQYGEAEGVLNDLCSIQRKALPANSGALAANLDLLGNCLLKQRKYSKAAEVLTECATLYQQRDADDWLGFKVKIRLGMALLGLKKYVEAEGELTEGYNGLKERESQASWQRSSPLPQRRSHESREALCGVGKTRPSRCLARDTEMN